jgi:hypothetical protein
VAARDAMLVFVVLVSLAVVASVRAIALAGDRDSG